MENKTTKQSMHHQREREREREGERENGSTTEGVKK